MYTIKILSNINNTSSITKVRTKTRNDFIYSNLNVDLKREGDYEIILNIELSESCVVTLKVEIIFDVSNNN